jgi:SHS family lactate transporter-like MFS transporter
MPSRLTSDQRYSLLATVLAWSMDTFDYFMLVLVLPDIGNDASFAADRTHLGYLLFATLVMRPFGALFFGMWADRVGRRGPLIADVLLYSCTGILCALAPNFTALLILRAIFGFGMGGEWGLGTALALEKLPPDQRGLYSGLLQMGYPLGYLLASLAYLLIRAIGLDWRWIFVLSIIPALTTLLLRRRVEESQAWEATRKAMRGNRTTVRDILRNPVVVRRFCYLIVLMTALNWMAHGAQDIYPAFLRSSAKDGGAGLSPDWATWISVCYTLGAMAASVVFGALSERLGRRRAIVLAAALGLLVIPLFAFPDYGMAALVMGALLMQFAVQGAWGVVPAHLTEMSPDAIRGFYPGVTYQAGNLLAAVNQIIQPSLAHQHGYPFALSTTMGLALIAVIAATVQGPEEKGAAFGSGAASAPPSAYHLLACHGRPTRPWPRILTPSTPSAPTCFSSPNDRQPHARPGSPRPRARHRPLNQEVRGRLQL